MSRLTGELSRARDTLANLESDLERERRKTTLSGSGGTLSGSGGIEVRSAGALVRKYGELYAQTRLDTLESLDRLPELDNLDDLKSKLLFSVIVVSKKGDIEIIPMFRSYYFFFFLGYSRVYGLF